MHLVYDIDLETSCDRRILHLLLDIPDILNTVVGCRIYLNYIYGSACCYGFAGLAFIAGTAVMLRSVRTVDCSCKYFGSRGFACPSCTTKEIGMTYPV